jgi:hypothetical protein
MREEKAIEKKRHEIEAAEIFEAMPKGLCSS